MLGYEDQSSEGDQRLEYRREIAGLTLKSRWAISSDINVDSTDNNEEAD